MKSKKVLLGLFVGLMALTAGSAMAQTQSNSLIEVGPCNLGGRVLSLLLDESDSTYQTIYAGAAGGGLFVRDANHDEWERVSCTIDGKEVVLPITSMTQGSDNSIYIATGEQSNVYGISSTDFTALGRGLVKFNPATREFTQMVPAPQSPEDVWAVINKVAMVSHNGHDYLYIATARGLYRWDVNHEAEPVMVFAGTRPVDDVELVGARNLGYFSCGNQVYKLSSIWGENWNNYVNISGTNAAFGGNNHCIELAVAPSDPSYLYAMVIGNNGLLQGLYLSKNQQTWTLLNTSSIVPFTANNGVECGALTVDPGNANRIFMAGTSIYVGEGFVENSYFQWQQASQSEQYLNGGDYMAQVYSYFAFVHSGIHQILPVWRNNHAYYYIATDGGVFYTSNDFTTFSNLNRGLNVAQIKSLAVSPDGSLLSGVRNNSTVFIQSRMAHNGGETNNTWYDSISAMNHLGNVIFNGEGSGVAASMFQQILPQSRRAIFLAGDAGYARSNKDYNDFTNTQTWTYGQEFLGLDVMVSETNPNIALFETTNSTVQGDSISFSLDVFNTNNEALRQGAIIIRAGGADTIGAGEADTIQDGEQIKAGDKMYVVSRAHSYYPFIYTFTKTFTYHAGMDTTITAHNPIHSRLAIVGRQKGVEGAGPSAVFVNWYPSDFTKVYRSGNEYPNSTKMFWAKPLVLGNTLTTYNQVAWSNDGNHLFATIDDQANGKSWLVRVSGFNDSVLYDNNDLKTTRDRLDLKSGSSSTSTMIYDTVAAFDRLINNIYVNPQAGSDAMLITFGGYDDSHDNVVYIKNISTCTKANQDSNVLSRSTANRVDPVYSGMIALDATTNAAKVFVGTENGAYVADFSSINGSSFNANAWSAYGNFNGVPVTAMCQQTKNFPTVRVAQHTGFNIDQYLFARTKYPYAMYFGTYGRGIFMDSTFVVDHENEIADSQYLDIPVVYANSINNVRVYPNPAVANTNLELTIAKAGSAVVKVYDMSGKLVINENYGRLAEGTYTRTINCEGLRHGMYLVNIVVGDQTATTKLIVR